MTLLKGNETPTFIPSKYTDFADIYSKDLAVMLPKHTRINDHAINLIERQQPSYGPMYSSSFVKLEILKNYIKTKLTNSFTRSFMSLISTPIIFVKKLDRSF